MYNPEDLMRLLAEDAVYKLLDGGEFSLEFYRMQLIAVEVDNVEAWVPDKIQIYPDEKISHIMYSKDDREYFVAHIINEDYPQFVALANMIDTYILEED